MKNMLLALKLGKVGYFEYLAFANFYIFKLS